MTFSFTSDYKKVYRGPTEKVQHGVVDITSYNNDSGDPDETVSARDFGLNTLSHVEINDAATSNGYVVEYDEDNNAFLVYHADNDAGSDGPLIEAADTDTVGDFHVTAVGW